ncbi:MAG: 2-C-methyl-D-erythritol 2,4-cyclodiphosphate synthase [Dehalococcoidia bacterium]|nr:2-C-methyl-D-erythritol 2,4-cyclodiphosphate synthase [Dehalococcoidia bacterium]
MRVGIGYDVHRLTPHRKLVLGGVEIPSDRGLDGHSDADVLVHALMDALLGAAGLPDIGVHFPNSDPQYKDAASIFLLGKVAQLISRQGFAIGNVDVTVIAEKPKISPAVSQMRDRLSKALSVPPGSIGIKATTNEGLGFIGRGEGIAAIAVALLQGPSGD